MDSFTKVIGVVRIVFVQFILLLTWPGFFANLGKDLEENAVNKDLSYLISVFVIGALCMFWLIRTMTRPRRNTEEGFTKTLSSYSFDFLSTHPSYIFIDGILFLWAYALTEFSDNSTFEIWHKYAYYALAILVPVLRLFFWYVVGLKFSKEECVRAWKPVMWFWIIAGPFVLAIFIMG
jgi:hypothetical protein